MSQQTGHSAARLGVAAFGCATLSHSRFWTTVMTYLKLEWYVFTGNGLSLYVCISGWIGAVRYVIWFKFGSYRRRCLNVRLYFAPKFRGFQLLGGGIMS